MNLWAWLNLLALGLLVVVTLEALPLNWYAATAASYIERGQECSFNSFEIYSVLNSLLIAYP